MRSCACSWRNLGCPIWFLPCLDWWFLSHGERLQGKAAPCMACRWCQGGPRLPWVLLPAPGLRVASHGQPHDQWQPTSNCSLSWQDKRNRDLSQCCGIRAGYNRFMDLHRYKLTALGKSSSTAPMLIKTPEQNTLLSRMASLASKVGITALRDRWVLQPTSVQSQTD